MNTLLSRIPRIPSRLLRLAVPACGGAGLLLRLLLTATGLDDKGLMIPWHPVWICLWLLTIAAALVLAAGVLPIQGPADYRASFPSTLPALAGYGLAFGYTLADAVGYFRAGPDGFGLIPTLQFCLGGAVPLLAAAAFFLAGLCRLRGRKTPFLTHVAICIWFALQMLELYRTWSFDPQLQDYCFQLFACIALTITAYELAVFDMGRGSHRKLWFWGLAAVYLCCLSVTDSLFFLAGGVWAFGSLSSLRLPRRRRSMDAEIPADQE